MVVVVVLIVDSSSSSWVNAWSFMVFELDSSFWWYYFWSHLPSKWETIRRHWERYGLDLIKDILHHTPYGFCDMLAFILKGYTKITNPAGVRLTPCNSFHIAVQELCKSSVSSLIVIPYSQNTLHWPYHLTPMMFMTPKPYIIIMYSMLPVTICDDRSVLPMYSLHASESIPATLKWK